MTTQKATPPMTDGADVPPVPVFVPWDGATRTVTLLAKNGTTKKKVLKSVPSMLADLIEKQEGNISSVGRAMGSTASTIHAVVAGKAKFDEKKQRQVFAALHGAPSAGVLMPDEPDTYKLDMAIAQLHAKNYDRVNDVADLLNGRVIFRMNTTGGWLVIYRMKSDDARKFKRIVLRDCQKVVCP